MKFFELLSSGTAMAIFFGIIFLALVAALAVVLLKINSIKKRSLPKELRRKLLLVMLPKEVSKEETPPSQYIKSQIALAEGLFSSLGGMKAQRGLDAAILGRKDVFSFEIVAHRGLISFYISLNESVQNYVQQVILAHYPNAHIQEVSNYNIFLPKGKSAGTYLTFEKEYIFPIKTYMRMEGDPLQTLTNTLSTIAEHEGAVIQIVARSAKKSWHNWGFKAARELQQGNQSVTRAVGITAPGITMAKTLRFFSTSKKKKQKSAREEKEEKNRALTPMAQETIKSLEEKTAKAGLDANIRIVVSAVNQNAASRYLENITEAFNQYSFYQYGNKFQAEKIKNPSGFFSNFVRREFNDKYRILLNAEEFASIYHLPTPLTETPNIRWMLARRLPPPSNIPNTGLYLGENVFQGVTTPIYLKEDDRRRHQYIIGMTGTGKSTFLENLAIQDIKNNNGVCVIDPHGTLVENILAATPEERANDVILFDTSDIDRPIGLNILEAKSEQEKDLATQEMIAIFYKLVTDPSMIGPMFEHNMRNAMLTLMADSENPGTIIDIPRIFTDPDFQKSKIEKVTDPLVRNFWEKEMKKTSDFHKSEMLGYLISKVGRFVENSLVRNIIGQRRSTLNLLDAMNSKKIILVNLSKGKIGEMNSALLGLILVSKIQMAALSRARMPENERNDFYLYIDEFQNFITDSISIILAEARKYRLNLILAHQYLGQLGGGGTEGKAKNSSVRDAVFGNVGTIVSFRIGVDDAETISKQFSPGASAYDVMNIEKFNAYARLLIDNQPSRPFSIKTPPPVATNTALAMKIRELSRMKYGRDKSEVEKEITENLSSATKNEDMGSSNKPLS